MSDRGRSYRVNGNQKLGILRHGRVFWRRPLIRTSFTDKHYSFIPQYYQGFPILSPEFIGCFRVNRAYTSVSVALKPYQRMIYSIQTMVLMNTYSVDATPMPIYTQLEFCTEHN